MYYGDMYYRDMNYEISPEGKRGSLLMSKGVLRGDGQARHTRNTKQHRASFLVGFTNLTAILQRSGQANRRPD
jgi:hypothetical protein